MTWSQSFFEHLFETAAVMIFMSCFSSAYLAWKKTPFIIVILSLVAIIVENIALGIAIQYLICYLSMILLCFVFFKRNPLYILIEFLIANFIVAMTEFLLVSVQYTFNSTSPTFLEKMIYITIILTIALMITRKNRILMRFRILYDENVQAVFLITINIVAIFIAIIFVWENAQEALYEKILYITIFVILQTAGNIYILRKLIRESRNRVLMEAYKHDAESSQIFIDDIYMRKHEYNKHLQAIYNMCGDEETNERLQSIKAYIGELKNENNQNQNKFTLVNTGNELINGLIYRSQKEAAKNDITVECAAFGGTIKLPCLQYEVVEIIGNLLENSIEYLRELSDECHKRIYLELISDGTHSCIKVKNDYYDSNQTAEEITQKGYTTKKGTRRGYGLFNVKRIVQKYNGTLTVFL